MALIAVRLPEELHDRVRKRIGSEGVLSDYIRDLIYDDLAVPSTVRDSSREFGRMTLNDLLRAAKRAQGIEE